MKFSYLILIPGLFLFVMCNQQAELSEKDKNQVKEEVRKFLRNIESELEVANAEKYKKCFLENDELAVATQGELIISYKALCDTIDKHLSVMQKQSIQPVDERIFVIDRDHAVFSASKITNITFKNGYEVKLPFAWTLFIVKRNGEWKIAHAHN